MYLIDSLIILHECKWFMTVYIIKESQQRSYESTGFNALIENMSANVLTWAVKDTSQISGYIITEKLIGWLDMDRVSHKVSDKECTIINLSSVKKPELRGIRSSHTSGYFTRSRGQKAQGTICTETEIPLSRERSGVETSSQHIEGVSRTQQVTWKKMGENRKLMSPEQNARIA